MSHTAEIIAVGTELLLGNIANTNAQVLSQSLSGLGVNVFWHTVVGDNPERLAQAVSVARRRATDTAWASRSGLSPTTVCQNTLTPRPDRLWDNTWALVLAMFPKSSSVPTAMISAVWDISIRPPIANANSAASAAANTERQRSISARADSLRPRISNGQGSRRVRDPVGRWQCFLRAARCRRR